MGFKIFRVAMARMVLAICTFLCLSASAAPVPLTEQNALAPVNRSSPSETYHSLITGVNHLEELYKLYTEDKSFANIYEIRYQFNRLRRLLDLSAVSSANKVKVGNEAITYLADILARLPTIDPSTIPGYLSNGTALPSHWTIPGTDIQIARMDTGSAASEYLFTVDSIENLAGYYQRILDLPVLHARHYRWFHREHMNATGPLVPEWLASRVPDSLKAMYLNTPVWKIIAIIFVIFFMAALTYLWVRIVRAQARRTTELKRLCWRFTLPVMIILIYYITERFVISHINPGGIFASGETLIITAALYMLGAWAAGIGCFLVVEAMINTSRVAGNSLDTHMLRLAARVAAIASVGAILIYGANEIGIPAFGLIAGIGVGGFALALAAQSTIENLFGGVALFADRPFRIGDFITFGSESGSVEAVGTRSTRIRLLDGTLVTVPNGDLAKMKIVNLTRRDKCLFLQKLALRADTSPDKLRVLLERIRLVAVAEPAVEKKDGWPRIRCTGVAIGYIEVEVRAYITTVDYGQFLAIQETLLLQIFELIEELDIKLATAQNFLPMNAKT